MFLCVCVCVCVCLCVCVCVCVYLCVYVCPPGICGTCSNVNHVTNKRYVCFHKVTFHPFLPPSSLSLPDQTFCDSMLCSRSCWRCWEARQGSLVAGIDTLPPRPHPSIHPSVSRRRSLTHTIIHSQLYDHFKPMFYRCGNHN